MVTIINKEKKVIITSILLGLMLFGCSKPLLNTGPKKDAVSFEEKTIDAQGISELLISSDYSNIEIYLWDKKEVKFENTKKLRGYDENILREKLGEFKTDIGKDNGKISLKSVYSGDIKSPADRSFDIKLHVPKSLQRMSLKVKIGTIKALDDLKCDVNIDTEEVNTQINSIYSKLNVIGKMGNVNILNGKLKKGSSIKLGMGNINIKSEIDIGEYAFHTEVGNVDLCLPEASKVNLETVGSIAQNDFITLVGAIGEDKAMVKVSSGMGKISIRKY